MDRYILTGLKAGELKGSITLYFGTAELMPLTVLSFMQVKA
jgi:hypothetical protein